MENLSFRPDKTIVFHLVNPQDEDFGCKSPRYVRLKKKLYEHVERYCFQGYTTFFTDGSRRMGLLLADTVLKAKKRFPDLNLIIIISPRNNGVKLTRCWENLRLQLKESSALFIDLQVPDNQDIKTLIHAYIVQNSFKSLFILSLGDDVHTRLVGTDQFGPMPAFSHLPDKKIKLQVLQRAQLKSLS